MKKIILLLLLAPAIHVMAQSTPAKSPWTGAPAKSSVPTPVTQPGLPPVNNGAMPSNLPNNPGGMPVQNNTMFPGQVMPGQATPGIVNPGAITPPEAVQDNVSVVYLGKVNGKIFAKTKDGRTYALVSPSTYKRTPKIDIAPTTPVDVNGGMPVNNGSGPNVNGLPSMVGGPNRTPINR